MKRPQIIFLLVLFWPLNAICQNLVSSQSWTVGTGSVGIFTVNGSTSENSREMGTDPYGSQSILWKASPNGDNAADGGFITQSSLITNTKMYRLTVWMKKNNSQDGYAYFGCQGNYIHNLDGTVNANPYFWYGSLPQLNKWYFLVAYIHASDDPSTTNYGGVYDGATGAKVASVTDFKFSPSATQAQHRAYLYYDPNTSDRLFFYNPEMYQMSGNQPLAETALSSTVSGNAFFGKKVGIGTNDPGYGRFQVSQLSDASDQGIAVLNSTGVRAMRLWTDLNNSYVYSGATGQANLILNGTGNVGVGTANPNQKLTVNGTIYGKEVLVDLNVPGPDYVFEKDYRLPSLDEVKSYIEKNKHLPEVPSAKEMEANGINVSEMNMILLKKIEELTLYLIEERTETKSLREEIKKMQIEIELLKK